MSAGFDIDGQMFYGSNGAIESYVQAIAEQAAARFGPEDEIAVFFREAGDGYFPGMIVFLDPLLRDAASRARFVELLDVVTEDLLRQDVWTEDGQNVGKHPDRGVQTALGLRPSGGITVKTKRTIRNCPLPVFRRVCPRQWEELAPTADASVRHCGQCRQNVYFCATDEETLSHARAGHCIARVIPDESELPVMYLGEPKNVPPTSLKQDEALLLTHRERGIDDALKNLNAPRACPRCHYPAPGWRSGCRVCGLKFDRVAPGGEGDA